MYSVKESDWKLFRKLLPEWQERFMGAAASSRHLMWQQFIVALSKLFFSMSFLALMADKT